MKSAEDWIREFSEITPLTQGAVEYVREIQLDAYKQGVDDAENRIFWKCPVCQHVMTEEESKNYRRCPNGIHFAQHEQIKTNEKEQNH